MSVAATIAACAAGAAAMRRNWNKNDYSIEEITEIKEPIYVKVLTRLKFKEFTYFKQCLSNPFDDEDKYVAFSKETIPNLNVAFITNVQFATTYQKRHSISKLEQLAVEFVSNHIKTRSQVEDIVNSRINSICCSDKTVLDKASQYEIEMLTDSIAIWNAKSYEEIKNSDNVLYYMEY